MAQILLALSGTSFSEIVSNFLTELAFNRIEAAYAARNKNDDSKEVNITPWETKMKDKDGNETDELVDKDQWSTDKKLLNQFGTYGSQKSSISENLINLNTLFYQQVRKAEKKTGEEALWMDFGSGFQNLKSRVLMNMSMQPQQKPSSRWWPSRFILFRRKVCQDRLPRPYSPFLRRCRGLPSGSLSHRSPLSPT